MSGHDQSVLEATLLAALVRLTVATTRAREYAENDDTLTADGEATKAVTTAAQLSSALSHGDVAQGLHLLHGLNNKLTGVLSVTMLAREDLADTDAGVPLLSAVENDARAAATAARALADALKATLAKPT